MSRIWDAFRRGDQSRAGQAPPKDSDQFPDTPYSYGESQPWLKHAVDASWWQENGDHLMAARVGRRAVELAPADQMSNASADLCMALNELGRGTEKDEAEIFTLLTSTVTWLLRSGWLDEPWQSPFTPPSEQAAAAWSIFPAAGIALIKRAQAAARNDILDTYASVIIERLTPMTSNLAAMHSDWLARYLPRT